MFLNEVYKTTDPKNEALYSMQEIETKEVYESVISKAEFMSKKSEIGFASWCSKRKVNFIGMPHTRKRRRGLNLRFRTLYVMKHEFRENIIKSITTAIPHYQNHISSLKKQGYSIIGYARKSVGFNNDNNRKSLLNGMVQCLKERSLCDKVFVSCSCSAGDELTSRDMNANTVGLLNELIGVDGDTQSMLSYINSSEIDICLVVIDFAGLSTNKNDIHRFFSIHKN
ncbi:uncharacterized protein EV154DRAFT_490691 [Mucor mucedo]|uniref:uncharacterized protein n=1 Tax=Mucor mucedo TaxID=29922 RepID=UPI00221E551C|nr:uncharacterized protein EV154DRAFT_490691 [Mucor mucedo]KAI7896737.1 hypothetical protein EV154DRAFT_490691 [Mucor mucedo]